MTESKTRFSIQREQTTDVPRRLPWIPSLKKILYMEGNIAKYGFQITLNG
jgi:hypothetical protein